MTQSQHKYGNVVLGFTETATEQTNAPEHFASKAGGKPTWLYRWPHIGAHAPRCKGCGEVEAFLGQVYAPIEEGAVGHINAFHRVLYVTVCTTGGCSNRRDGTGATVLRGQLARKNPFYLYTAEEGDVAPVSPVKDPCVICGFWGELVCGGCHAARYCSKRCQREDWALGHGNHCRTTGKSKPVLKENKDEKQMDVGPKKHIKSEQRRFAELEIVTDRHPTPPQSDSDEDDLDDEDRDKDPNNVNTISTKEPSSFQVDNDNLVRSPSTLATQDEETEGNALAFRGTMQDADDSELPDELFRGGVGGQYLDVVHSHFNKVVAYEPDQVVRYERGGRPLWASSRQQCDSAVLPPCENCGKKRVFEMQLMPQIVYMLERAKREKDALIDSGSSSSANARNATNRMNEVARRLHHDMDWATIVLFTCVQSCQVEIGCYVEEYAWVQRYT